MLILAGDHIYKMNYAKMIEAHVAKNASLTIACVNVPKSEANQLGIAVTNEDHQIIGFQEKPKKDPATIPGNPEQCFASMGIYVFSTDELVRRVSQDSRQESAHDFGKNVIPAMVNDGARVFAYPFKDENKKEVAYWRDVGTMDAYFDANMDLTGINPLFNLYDESWQVRTYREPAPPVKFVFSEAGAIGAARRGEALESVISPGTIISGGTVERSVLSPHVRVNSYSHVEDCILMEGVNVGRHARIRKAIVDKGVNIPEGVTIGHNLDEDRKRFAVSAGGVVIVPKPDIDLLLNELDRSRKTSMPADHNSATGYLCIMLHAHLPFVRHPEHPEFLEEDWFYEAVSETYIPLLRMLDGFERDGVNACFTMSLTPPLCEMMADPLLQGRYDNKLKKLIELTVLEQKRTAGTPFEAAAKMYEKHFNDCKETFEALGQKPRQRFPPLSRQGFYRSHHLRSDARLSAANGQPVFGAGADSNRGQQLPQTFRPRPARDMAA